MKLPGIVILSALGGAAYWYYQKQQEKKFDELANFLLPQAPPNSGPVVNGISGLGDNIFNQPWRAQQAFTGGRNAAPIRSLSAGSLPMQASGPTYRFPRQPSFWRGF